MVVSTNGKNSISVLLVIYKQCYHSLNNIVSTPFTSALAFSMAQVSFSYFKNTKISGP